MARKYPAFHACAKAISSLILLIFLLQGCSRTGKNNIRHDMIASYEWSPRGDISIVVDKGNSGRSEMVALAHGTSVDVSRSVLESIDWSPDGRYLLFCVEASDHNPVSAIYGRVMLYDILRHKSYPLVDTSVVITSICWTGPSSVAFTGKSVTDSGTSFDPKRMISELQAPVSIYSLDLGSTPHLIGTGPAALTPVRLFYDYHAHRFYAVAVLFQRATGYTFLYSIDQGRFTPVANSEGYNSWCSYAKQAATLAVERVDSRAITHAIDLVDFRPAEPAVTSVVTGADLPHGAELNDLDISEDGTKIVYSLAADKQPMTIYLHDAHIMKIQKIGEGVQPKFTPDGKHVSFVENYGTLHAPGLRLYLCDLDGSNTHVIYTVPSNNPGEYSGAPGNTVVLGSWIFLIVLIATAICFFVLQRRRTLGSRQR